MSNAPKRRTAEEFLAELDRDPTARENRERSDRAHYERVEKIRQAQEPLVRELRAVGLQVDSVWDLVNTRARYPRAIPVLMQHLERDYIPEVREGIARALAVPESADLWHRLLEIFGREPPREKRDVKWALAVALAGASTEETVDGLMTLVRDPSNGKYRLAWLRPLLRSKNPKARELLESLRSDPDLRTELRFLLGRRKRDR
jgi:hypothetical protein